MNYIQQFRTKDFFVTTIFIITQKIVHNILEQKY